MLSSLDGKISTGAADELDFDRDLPEIKGVCEGLFDFIDLVIAPVLVGGKDTSTVIDGESLLRRDELCRIAPLRLLGCEVLKDSYVRLRYEVIK